MMVGRASRFAPIVFLLLIGCATPYQEGGFAGGVQAQQLSQDTFRISAYGNGYTSRERIYDFVLMKAAETSKANGASHFVIVAGEDASSIGVMQSPGHMSTQVFGSTAYSTYTPGIQTQYERPAQIVTIKLHWAKPGTAAPAGAQSADDVLRFVGPRIAQ